MPYLDAPTAPVGDGRLSRIRRILAADRQQCPAPSPAHGLAERPGVAAVLEEVGSEGFRDERLDAWGGRVLSQIERLEQSKARLESRLLEAYAALHTIQAQQLDRLASATTVPVHPERVVAAEIACATGVGTGEVARRLELALTPRRHRVLREALRDGRVSLYRALAVVAETRALPDDRLPALETTVLAPAPDGTVASQRLFTARLRRCVTTADPRGHDERRQAATARRTAFGRLTDDGMGTLTVVATAERVVGVLDRVDLMARSARAAGDPRTLDQLRSDLLTDLALFGTAPEPHAARRPGAPGDPAPRGASEHADGRGAGGGSSAEPAGPAGPAGPLARGPQAPPALVRIVVPFEVACGTSDAACELPGHGWVTAAHARAIMTAPGSVWQRLAVDVDTGHALELSTDRYAPTAAMVRHVRSVDGLCRAPGCQLPADRCDLDHVTPWPQGPTRVSNLQSLSRSCHNLKTLGAWTVHRDGDASRWRTLAGREYVTYPRNWRESLADSGADSDSGPGPGPVRGCCTDPPPARQVEDRCRAREADAGPRPGHDPPPF